MRRHPPLITGAVVGTMSDFRCDVCGRDPLEFVHWPPRGLKERILDFFGLLRA